jgi:hypothetical protein
MPRLPGTPKTGGRVKGSPNKRTVEAREILAKLKCDPLRGMARLALDKNQEPALRGRMFAELAKYVYPQLNRTAHENPDGSPLSGLAWVDSIIAAGNDAG